MEPVVSWNTTIFYIIKTNIYFISKVEKKDKTLMIEKTNVISPLFFINFSIII